MDEFEIIAEIFAPLSKAAWAFGLKDDAAAIPPRPGFDLVVTTDQIAEGIDFFAFDPADSIAKKALLVNLSDLAAKGAGAQYYLLNLALTGSVTREWLASFARGLSEIQEKHGLSLIGGDTGSSEAPLSIAVTAFGFVPAGMMIRRNGVKAGDNLYVTGTIGDSGGGLAIFRREIHSLTDAQRDGLVGRYRIPAPPLEFGPALIGRASAAIDVSDGLVADLGHMARASGVKLVVDAQAIPRSEALRALWGDGTGGIVRAATAGDDYQIAFTAPPSRQDDILAHAARTGTRVTLIGRAEVGQGTELLLDGQVLPVPNPGYRHFQAL